jgi:hypothetical protein
MKIRKYKKLRRKWIMGQKMTHKEIGGLQGVHPEKEWKHIIKLGINPPENMPPIMVAEKNGNFTTYKFSSPLYKKRRIEQMERYMYNGK